MTRDNKDAKKKDFGAPCSVSPGGEQFPLPQQQDYAAEFKRVQALAERARSEGKEIVVVMGVGFERGPARAQRAWYYSHIYADPKNAETVYLLNTGFYKSIDGGRTLTSISTPHGDSHDLWIDPSNPQRMIETNDGSANVRITAEKYGRTRQSRQLSSITCSSTISSPTSFTDRNRTTAR